MKNIKYLILPLLLFAVSCEDFLEVDPKTQIPEEAALTNGRNLESTLIAAYSDIVSDDFLGQRVRLYSELLSDNIGLNEISLSSTDFTGQVALRNTNILNKDVDNLWSSGYRAIARVNAVINAIDNNLITDNTSAANKQLWKAESLFLRGIAHFELVRLFGKPYSNTPTTDLGIPIRIKSLKADEKLPRASVNEVYNQVIEDLLDAIALLPNENGNRANKWAAKGYLARVYFNKLDYANAFTTANDIINEGFSISGDPLTAFRNNGNVDADGGVLFQIVSGGNPFGGFRPAARQWSMSQGSNGLFQDLSSYSATDFRLTDMLTEDQDRQFSLKWDDNVINPPIIRMSEIYLIHAESAALLTAPNLPAASSSYNIVRSFADEDFDAVNFTNSADALDAIRLERRIELAFEGDRYHELKRLKSTSFGEVRQGTTIIREAKAYNDAAWLLKIPVSETSGNPAIVQN